ncbi:hypothetical protein NTGBS_770004 [Candidatus Nitrotoga sp. BS]|uniref:hypothetical protein n=1 Tax=Candidatus Nitrotoga sp. BS TaxID=2890408 RepID=UPI001EF2AFEA|nr:hypothetical protein [Candidatus Nitrotoga sp. BS]CAH1208299.1 hypothetical protein NTGBS_770004 [Candidatus Nitrotoga sp. BS]
MHENKIKQAAAVAFILVVIILSAWLWSRDKPSENYTAASASVPLVMHTSGGRLEVATVTVTEAFKLADPKELLGINLGTTVSQVQVPVIYRYFIEMAKEWPITSDGQSLIVQAGEIKTQLPVAFDTRTIEKYTTSGWARFNKAANLDKLEKDLSPRLEARAPGYKKLAIESARKSVSDFVTTWLLKHHPQPDGTAPRVQIFFPGESAALQIKSNLN